ncbi:MAG TPA: polysaccharide deacetylase family protein [Cytophagaceae bacterium]|jgi:peptidoglycan/xylan/chitin deacetylase (PgdA/CDA1 family)|nr:polysaccharide deacetylase family protein [Cytophagaceae bacterium]
MLLIFLTGLFFLLSALYLLGKGKGTPVLLYHQVNPLINVTPELFEEHLKYIAARYQTLTYTQAYEQVRQYGKLSENCLLITFDDGYYDNYKIVFPLLKKYNLQATFFINTLFIKQEARKENTPFVIGEQANIDALLRYYAIGEGSSDQYMTTLEIQEMQASGLCDFQAHTHTHAPVFVSNELSGFRSSDHSNSSPVHLYQGKVEEGYPVFKSRSTMVVPGFKLDLAKAKSFAAEWRTKWKTLSKEEALKAGKAYLKKNPVLTPYSQEEAETRVIKEIVINKEQLERITGKEVKFFAWTWGHRSAWGRDIMRKQGMVGFISCKKGGIGLTPDWMNLKRIELKDPSMKKLRKTLALTGNAFTSWIYSAVS